jgi:Mitochondrial ribosomal protein (VAR1)
LKKDFRILTEIGNLLYKEKNKPVKIIENDLCIRKNNLLPLSIFSNHHYHDNLCLAPCKGKSGCNGSEKESLLNKKTYDYLNSVSLNNLKSITLESTTIGHHSRGNVLNGNDPGKDALARVKTRNDVIYQYLKTFSIFNKRKNGILIKYNKYISYNFNSKNILLRGIEPQTNKSFKTNNKIKIPLGKETKINKVNATLKELNRLESVSRLIGYNRSTNHHSRGNGLNGNDNRLIKYSYKLLFYFFKSMYCLISKPVILFTPDKVIIQLFYYLNIPKFKVFKWYSILNNKIIRQKWYSLFELNNSNYNNNPPYHHYHGSHHYLDNDCQGNDGGLANRDTGGKNLDKLNILNIPSSDFKLSNKNNVLSYSNKKMMNKVKLSWRIKKTLFRLNKKRNKVKLNLFNLNKFNLFKVFSIKFKLICEILSNKFKKPVELQLIRIHHPFHDSNILANLLSLNIKNKKFKTNIAIEKLYAKKTIKNLYDYNVNSVIFIPAFLSGIKIRIGGRLMREPIIPRITTKNFERGASSPGKVNFLDTATINKKNKKGSYTIKISSGQNFF